MTSPQQSWPSLCSGSNTFKAFVVIVDDLGKEIFTTGCALDRSQKVHNFSPAHLSSNALIMVHDIILLVPDYIGQLNLYDM